MSFLLEVFWSRTHSSQSCKVVGPNPTVLYSDLLVERTAAISYVSEVEEETGVGVEMKLFREGMKAG